MKPLLEKGDLDNWNGYFDNDNVQTLFLDGIVMHIMVGNGEIHFVYNETKCPRINLYSQWNSHNRFGKGFHPPPCPPCRGFPKRTIRISVLLWITGLVDIYAIVYFLALRMNRTHLQRIPALDVVGTLATRSITFTRLIKVLTDLCIRRETLSQLRSLLSSKINTSSSSSASTYKETNIMPIK